MASVRMSNQLRQEIEHKGSMLFGKSLQKAQNKLADDFGDRAMDDIYAKYYEPYSEYIKKIPDDWTEKTNGLFVTVMGYVDGEQKRYTIRQEDTIKDYKIPRQESSVSNYSNQYYIDNHSLSDELWTELHEYNARINKITAEKDTFIKELKAVLGRCNTLKQFIDIWPHAEELIDQDKLDKLKEPVERTRQDRDMPPEVSTEINSILVKRTILNSRE